MDSGPFGHAATRSPSLQYNGLHPVIPGFLLIYWPWEWKAESA